jgi:hypothetical protein
MTSKKHNITLVVALLFFVQVSAQFKYGAQLEPVKETGFYSITVTPELGSYLKPDLSDLRIIDEKKQWVPYVINMPFEKRIHDVILFNQKIISKSTIGSKTVIVIENSEETELSNFLIELKNAAAERIGSLSGSDNNKDWFVILDSFILQVSEEYSKSSYSQLINFPTSAYKYFRLTINNEEKKPLNILKIGSSMAPSLIGSSEHPFLKNPPAEFLQKDTNQYSLLTIAFDRPFQINKFQVSFTGQAFYKRKAKIFTKINKDIYSTWHSQQHHDIVISSDFFSGYSIPMAKTDSLYILIENGDNPPLKASFLSTEVINRNIIAQLEKGKTYSLLLDDPDAVKPVYDLELFKDSIVNHAPLSIKRIEPLPQTKTENKAQTNKQWIWPVILLVLALLSFLTWKLTTDMKKNALPK